MYRIKLAGFQRANTEILQIQRNLRDLRPAWREISSSLSRFFKRQFETEGSAGGFPWAPRAPATKRILTIFGRGDTKILHDRGDLEDSLVNPTPSRGGIRIVNKLSLTWGSNVRGNDGFPYVVAAQEGFTSVMKPLINRSNQIAFVRRPSPIKIPPRVLMPDPVPPGMKAAWSKILLAHIARRRGS